MKLVVALGGNALLQRGEPLEAELQKENVARAAAVIARLAAAHTVAVTHGNGPQIGLLALQSESYHEVKPYPLDILGAQSEGMIGYLIELELQRLLPKRAVVTLLTQVEVSAADPAFRHPSNPIGPAFSEEQAQRLRRERGWSVAPDGTKWRRVVPAPEPLRIRELAAIRLLLSAGAVVICAGGGGIPVVASGNRLHGVEAVVDKDLAAALLAHQLGADALLLLTDVDAVFAGWGTSQQHALRETTPRELRHHAFLAGSMKPKVEAACSFIESGGKLAGIGRMEDALVILQGVRGTLVRPDPVATLDFTAADQKGPVRPAPFQAPREPEWTPFELPENAPPPKPQL